MCVLEQGAGCIAVHKCVCAFYCAGSGHFLRVLYWEWQMEEIALFAAYNKANTSPNKVFENTHVCSTNPFANPVIRAFSFPLASLWTMCAFCFTVMPCFLLLWFNTELDQTSLEARWLFGLKDTMKFKYARDSKINFGLFFFFLCWRNLNTPMYVHVWNFFVFDTRSGWAFILYEELFIYIIFLFSREIQ